MRFDDLTFTCSDGSPTVSVSLNLFVDGGFVFDPLPMDVGGNQGGRVEIGGTLSPGGSVALGNWAPVSAEGLGSSGAFVGVNADVVSGIFTSPIVTVPTNTPVTLFLSLGVRIGNCCEPGVRVNGYGSVKFANEGVGPVFNFHNVPQGVECTVNSTEAYITGNIWKPTVGIESRTWGQIKELYQ
jgi:hypothetical protein